MKPRDVYALLRPDVLIVHCDHNTCRLVQEILESEGYRVQIAVFGWGAAQVMRAAPPGLIVVLEPVVLMVEGNQDLCAIFDDTAQRARHVIVVFTGSFRAEEVCRRFHGDLVLTMPFTLDVIIDVVAKANAMRATKQRTIH